MEASFAKPEVIDSSKKSRSLELTGIHGEQSRSYVVNSLADNRERGLKRKNGPHSEREGPDFAESGKKRIRKELSISGFNPAFKRHRRSTLKAKGLTSGVRKRKHTSSLTGALHDLSGLRDNLHDSGCALTVPLPKNEDDQASSVGNLESLDGLDCTLTVPKWSCGFSGRKRSEKYTGTKRARGASVYGGKSRADDKPHKLAANLVAPSRASTIKMYRRFDECKENGSSRDSSGYNTKGASGTSVKASRRKVRSRKPQVAAVETQIHRENKAPFLEDNQNSSEYFLDEDEESLEENAAIMLSSRFDPRCTGLPAKRMTSSKLVNEPSLQPFNQTSKPSGLGLRPRKNNGKSFVRKRRHFYEVHYSDMDPYWVVKQRIRVFWPLDQSWYFGLVKDYDPVTKMHYIKYDDREEEWVDLQNERFKLLLFPSEVKFNSGRSRSRVKNKNEEGDKSTVDDDCKETITESETIISWLARSNRLVKSSSASIQKERSIHLPKELEPSISSASKGCMSASPPSLVSNKLSSTLPQRLVEGQIIRLPKMERRADSSNRKLSLVYFRKRFHRRKGIIDKHEGDSSCASLAGPIGLLASVADRESAFEELYVSVTQTKQKQIILKLSLPPLGIRHHVFGAESFLLFRTLLLHHGKLMHLWPKLHMEIVIVDRALGLRWLSFEGCLRLVLDLVCFIMTTFSQGRKHKKLSDVQAPYTSIGFGLSGLHDRRRHVLFTLCSFVELNSQKWRYLENKLKQQCMTLGELPIEECTHVNTKTLSSRSRRNQVFRTSIFEYPISTEFSSRRSCSDIMRQLVLNKSASLSTGSGLCYVDEDYRMLRPTVLSSAPAPLFFLSVHLNLLMENKAAAIGFQESNSTSSQDCPENCDKLTGEGCSPVADSSDQVSEISNENSGPAAASSGWSSIRHLQIETDALSVSTESHWVRSSHNLLNGEINISGNRVGRRDVWRKASNETFVCSQNFLRSTKSQRDSKKSCSPFHQNSSYPDKSESGYSSSQLFTQVEERSSDKRQRAAHCERDLLWEMNEHIVRSPNTTAPRSILHRNRHSSILPTFGQCSKLWPEDLVQNGFNNGSKKPRTQLSHSSRVGGCDLGLKHRSHHRKEQAHKKIKTDNTRRVFDISENPESYLESSTCFANVLVTDGDRGWRESGAQIVLDPDDQKGSRLSVKLSGTTKYAHRAHQFMQPGTTNRYTYAMMWKGGKDWTLEFTDRSQWSLFKVMYQECFTRNIKADSVKHIPIPGVRLIDDGEDNLVEVPFVRSSSKYHRQVGTEVDMALDPLHVLYDMDSSDEEWISNLQNSLDHQGSKITEVTDDMFERVIDMFEKVAYAEQSDTFTCDEIEEFMAGFGFLDIIKAIYEHWQQKRQNKGLPLVRQFQPPLWEHYRKQLKEWELAMRKIHVSSNGCQENPRLLEKPPMFAFCLRPRGLEIPNKGSKQKSHRKFMFMGHQNSFTREPDGFHAHGRRSNGPPVGEDKAISDVPYHEFSYSSHRLQSPSDDSDRSEYPKLYRSSSRKNRMAFSPRDSQILPFTNNEKSKRNEVHCWGADIREWPSRTKRPHPDGFQRHQADTDEFKLRDASSAARYAKNVAKLKRAKAQWLAHKADLALHKASVALMIAEVIKSSQEDLNGDG